ncbi:MAG: AraC family transcriptional regulator [Pseudomonadales bacterium]|nr:AraC family transcriptional regulator [Pseudomonadales bacterium]
MLYIVLMANYQQSSRVNDALQYIHSDINRNLSAATLAAQARYSEQHFHRVFHAVVGEPVNQYVRRIRLESAANHLMFNPQQAIIEIAEKCGFRSLSSFSQAFKKQFLASPGQWRTLKAKSITPPYLQDPELASAYQRIYSQALPEVQFVHLPDRHIAYIRHLGYGRAIKKTWQLLHAWAIAEGLADNNQLGLHHSNPTQTPLDQCRYVACIEIDAPLSKRGLVNSTVIPGGLHARFDFSGKYGELLPRISKILQQWLPTSGLIATTTPAFALYKKNQFLTSDEKYQLSFYLPVSFY